MRSISACGESKAGSSTMKVSKSSWSCSPSRSWCDGRLARSASASAPRPSSTGDRHLAVLGLDDLDGARQRLADLAGRRSRRCALDIRSALFRITRSAQSSWSSKTSSSGLSWSSDGSSARWRGDRLGIVGEAAGRDGRAVDHGDHAVDRDARGDLRPVEGLAPAAWASARPEVSMTICSGGVRPVEQALQRRHEIVGDGAADAAVGQLDDAVLRAALDAAALQDLAVDADIAELVDDHGEPAPAGILQHVADQRRLAGAEKAGDDRAGHLGDAAHDSSFGCSNPIGGTRAITPLRNAAGRSRQGTMPFVRRREACAAAATSVDMRARDRDRRPGTSTCRPRRVRPCRPLAHGQAFDGANLDMVFVYEQIANAIGQRCTRLVEIAVALTQPAAATGADVDDGTESHNGQILVAPAVVRDVRALFGVMLQAAIADGST